MTTTEPLSLVTKTALPDYPILPLLAERWSPYAYADRPVSPADLSSIFEAARWAASSYNEQPWTYLVATREAPVEFDRLLSCLVPGNQAWAKAAPVLVLGVVRLNFSQNEKVNRAAVHDLGLASANLVMEATSRELSVHQMIGILPDRARELYQIPEQFEAWTALAVGYKATEKDRPDGLPQRDQTPRQRKPAGAFVFTGAWGQPSSFVRGTIAVVTD